MADIDKVIKELERIYEEEHKRQVYADAIALLKEREPKDPVYSHQHKHYVCPKCSLVLDEARDDYCPCCGVKIAWDESRYDSI